MPITPYLSRFPLGAMRALLPLLPPLVLAITATPALAAQPNVNAVVFMYHHFGESRYPSTSVRLEQFEAHLRHLGEAGYTVWPLTRIVDHLRTGKPIPERTVAITIDDAYSSVYTEAYPRLRQRGWPFTVFVATDVVDQGLSAFMSWEQMREMQGHGASFANHSAGHDHLIRLLPGERIDQWRVRVGDDIRHAQERLEQELGAAPRLFAYPYGEYNTALAALIEGQGYVAFGQQSGAMGPLSDLRALPRFPMTERFAGLEDFRTKAASLALPVAAVRPWDPVTDADTPSMTLVLADSDARLAQLACYASHTGRITVAPKAGTDRPTFVAAADHPLPAGRSRYNCTAPAADSGRYYWFSHLWIRPEGREHFATIPAATPSDAAPPNAAR